MKKSILSSTTRPGFPAACVLDGVQGSGAQEFSWNYCNASQTVLAKAETFLFFVFFLFCKKLAPHCFLSEIFHHGFINVFFACHDTPRHVLLLEHLSRSFSRCASKNLIFLPIPSFPSNPFGSCTFLLEHAYLAASYLDELTSSSHRERKWFFFSKDWFKIDPETSSTMHLVVSSIPPAVPINPAH